MSVLNWWRILARLIFCYFFATCSLTDTCMHFTVLVNFLRFIQHTNVTFRFSAKHTIMYVNHTIMRNTRKQWAMLLCYYEIRFLYQLVQQFESYFMCWTTVFLFLRFSDSCAIVNGQNSKCARNHHVSFQMINADSFLFIPLLAWNLESPDPANVEVLYSDCWYEMLYDSNSWFCFKWPGSKYPYRTKLDLDSIQMWERNNIEESCYNSHSNQKRLQLNDSTSTSGNQNQ